VILVCTYILQRDDRYGRRASIFVERDTWQPTTAVAKRLSSVATGDLLRPEGGYGEGTRLLEPFLGGKGAVFEVSSMGA
jgi:hypothetical protein